MLKPTIRAVLLPSKVSLQMGWPRHQGQWGRWVGASLLSIVQNGRKANKLAGSPVPM